MNEITLETKIADLLNNYEGMKEILIGINPKFEKLNNPILRRTLARVAGVKQAAIVGGMDPVDLLNQLREAVGQKPLTLDTQPHDSSPKEEETPKWIEQIPYAIIDANALLEYDKNPLEEINKLLKKLNGGDSIRLLSDFRPEPLIEAFEKKGYMVYSMEESEDLFVTYIRK